MALVFMWDRLSLFLHRWLGRQLPPSRLSDRRQPLAKPEGAQKGSCIHGTRNIQRVTLVNQMAAHGLLRTLPRQVELQDPTFKVCPCLTPGSVVPFALLMLPPSACRA